MKSENHETELIRKQNLYIRQLEEQLNVCMEKDKAQELSRKRRNLKGRTKQYE